MLLLLTSCGSNFAYNSRQKLDEKIILQNVEFDDIKNWVLDDHHEALVAFNKSCKKILARPKDKTIGGINKIAGIGREWTDVCQRATKVKMEDAREFFEQYFLPYRVTSSKGDKGLFTGYHEPNLRGSFKKTKKYKYPVYSLPKNNHDRSLTRAEISQNKLGGKNLEILYVDDDIALFFMQIQGSGRIHLDNGKVVNLGFAGHNNHSYKAISNYMIKHYNVKLSQVSADFIKSWLKEDPIRGQKVMNYNQSYVFFHILKQVGPIGAQNVQLTPERSLAIDNKYLPFGAPIWVDTKDGYGEDFSKLVIAQDRGGAIKGVIRGDIFFGSTHKASKKASVQKHYGQYYLLLPKEVKPCCLQGN
jgi:membrane-bound lytic murein transglycosylase A